ncbi:MAG TPA: MFS transporter [Anaerolineales bacterium]|nr:MFS transporter [Anaerolineales bacterium]
MNPASTNAPRTSPLIATIAYYLAFIVLGMTTAASGPSLLKLAEHTASRLDQISLIFVFSALGYLIGSYFGGRAYDRFPGHKLMAITLIFIAIASIMIPLASTLSMLLFAMFLSGLVAGILDVGCNTLLLWTHGEKAGPFMNGLHFFFGVGSLIAPLLLAQVLLRTNDIHWMYYFFAIACVPMMIWMWLLPEPQHSVQKDNQTNGAFPVVPVALIVVLFLLYVGLELGFGNWVYTYAITLKLSTEVTAAYLTSVFWGSFTFGRLLGVWVSTRMKSHLIIVMDLIGCAVSTVIIMLWKESSLALWLGTFGLGLSMASIFPSIMMLAGERMQITGAITGWFLVGSGAGSMLVPWLLGQIFTDTGPQLMTTVLLVDIVGMVFVLLAFLSQRKVPIPVVETNLYKSAKSRLAAGFLLTISNSI